MMKSNDADVVSYLIPEVSRVQPELVEGSVHLWQVFLDLPERQFRHLDCTLSADERERAGRFVFDRDRRRFTAARGFLRLILAHYQACRPEQVLFRYGAGGKPELAPVSSANDLQFSVSHTFELAVYAVSRGRRVGIDAERLRAMPEVEAVVEHVFSAREQAAWYSLPEDQRQEAFFHAWTRKEAYLKAIGVGLGCPPDRIEVTLTPGEPARLLRVDGDPRPASGWSLEPLFPAGGYVGALAVEGDGLQLTYCNRPPAKQS